MLLDCLLSYLASAEQADCKAIYLHVLATNTVAIRFYEDQNFHRHRYLPFYYIIPGMPGAGYSYVLYVNGGQPSFSIIYPFCQTSLFSFNCLSLQVQSYMPISIYIDMYICVCFVYFMVKYCIQKFSMISWMLHIILLLILDDILLWYYFNALGEPVLPFRGCLCARSLL